MMPFLTSLKALLGYDSQKTFLYLSPTLRLMDSVDPALEAKRTFRPQSANTVVQLGVYHDHDAEGKRMVKAIVEETKQVAKVVTEDVEKALEAGTNKAKGLSPSGTNEDSPFGVTCKHFPTEEMTEYIGVDNDTLRICATLAGQMYGARSKRSFVLPKAIRRSVQILDFFDNEDLAATTPSFALAVMGSTMILVWCGTRVASNPVDIVVDAHIAPLASRAWMDTAPAVRAQGGILAHVESYFAQHGEHIRDLMRSHKIKRICLTGHSLGGGIAQVAHLFLAGQQRRDFSEWVEALMDEDVSIRTVAFAAPMTIAILHRNHQGSNYFLRDVGENMCNFVFGMDVVPRAYSCLGFMNRTMEAAVPEIVGGIPVPGIVKRFLRIQKILTDGINGFIEDQSDLIKVMTFYSHIGTIVYYADVESPPVLLRDEGFYYRPLPGKSSEISLSFQYLFRNIKYEKQSFATLTDMHNILVGNGCGPGLAYNIAEGKE